MQIKTKQKGFTIVELLVVIVVLGILASITIVTYNGIQDRAKVAKKVSDISSIKRKLGVYDATNGRGFSTSTGNLTDLNLGSISNSVQVMQDVYSMPECQAAPMTKDKYCFDSDNLQNGSYYSFVWWNNVEKRWVITDPAGTRSNYSTGPVGTGDYPQAWVAE